MLFGRSVVFIVLIEKFFCVNLIFLNTLLLEVTLLISALEIHAYVYNIVNSSFHLFQCIEEDSPNTRKFALNSYEKPFNTHKKHNSKNNT